MPVIRRVRLTSAHKPTGNTLHVGIPAPSELRIATNDGYTGYFLLYCDESGIEITDTWHATMDDALHQAEFEFTVRTDDWEILGL